MFLVVFDYVVEWFFAWNSSITHWLLRTARKMDTQTDTFQKKLTKSSPGPVTVGEKKHTYQSA